MAYLLAHARALTPPPEAIYMIRPITDRILTAARLSILSVYRTTVLAIHAS